MKISHLRLEPHTEGWTRLVVNIDASYTKNNTLWVATPDEFADWLTDDVYDAFLVAALWPAMYYNENIEIVGEVSSRLLFNIRNYVQHAIKAYRPQTHFVNVSVQGTKIAKQTQMRVATGFSGGIDAFTTVIDRLEDEQDMSRRIDTFTFYNVGSHGGGRKEAREIFINRYNLVKGFPKNKGIPFVRLDSNLYDFYKDNWEYDAGTLTRVFGCLAFQKVVKYYYLSGEFSYREHMVNHFDTQLCNIDEMTELYMLGLLSTENMEIILEGAQYNRMEKTIKVAHYAPARQYLNVCVNHWGESTDAHNCSHCFKCVRTMKALDVIGVLDDFKDVFDIDWYKANRKKLWLRYCGHEEDWDPFKKGIIEYAEQHHYPYLPTKTQVRLYAIGQKLYHPLWWIAKKTGIKK